MSEDELDLDLFLSDEEELDDFLSDDEDLECDLEYDLECDLEDLLFLTIIFSTFELSFLDFLDLDLESPPSYNWTLFSMSN